MAESSERELTADEAAYVKAARAKAFVLYEGTRTPHRSCGIALAETFDLPTPAYQALRRGGITGKGACGAIRAGEQVLGELLGDPDPTGTVTPALRAAVTWYQAAWPARLFTASTTDAPDIICDHLVRPHGDFAGPARKAFCTNLAADVAALAAEALCRFAPTRPPITPVKET
ncbi:MAG: hypothetical protein KF773_32740 [Deltaproteobacteria bacterium]|nr:hypothetical protein [Deltaproteobacteria bacterium]